MLFSCLVRHCEQGTSLARQSTKNSILLLKIQVNFTQSSKFCHTDLFFCHTDEFLSYWTLHSKVKYLKILVILSEWNERPNGLQGVSRSKKIHLQRRQDIVILSLLQKKQPNLSYWAVGEISIEFKTHFLNLWILRCAQYDKI